MRYKLRIMRGNKNYNCEMREYKLHNCEITCDSKKNKNKRIVRCKLFCGKMCFNVWK